MTNSLQQMAQRRDAWLNEKPGFSGGNELRLRAGDEAYAHFCASGQEDNIPADTFIKIYRSHSIQTPRSDQKPGFNTNFRYCLIQNGEGTECAYCAQGHNVIKERMSMWFYVYYILHSSMPPATPADKMPPMVQHPHESRMVFKEEVNAWRVWHSSAWSSSPWPDIIKANEFYKGLHKFVAQLSASGEMLQRRYKLYPMPGTPAFTPEAYLAAQQECTPIPALLKEALASPVAVNPATAQQAPVQFQQQPANNVIIPFNSAGSFTQPGSGAVVPTPVVPMPAPAFAFATPPAPSTGVVEASQPSEEIPAPWDSPAESEASAAPEESAPQNLPMKGMF
jgi:hypothetical protein